MKEYETVDLYCKHCRKSLKISYIVTGRNDAPVLPNIMIKCQHCKRVMVLKNYTEEKFMKHVIDGKIYI